MTKLYKPTITDFDNDKINELIVKKQEQFLYEVEENDKDYLKVVFQLSLELLHEISSYYYPDSKYPEYELTITEASNLIHYIVDKIMSIFDKPVIKYFKNYRISTIKKSIDKVNEVKNNKALKAYKNSGMEEAYSTIRTIKNTLNPVFWFKKIFINGTYNIVIKKICRAGLSIIGEESNKVYSKNLFDDKNISDKTVKDIEEIYSDEA